MIFLIWLMLMTDVFAKPNLYVVQCHEDTGEIKYTSKPMIYKEAKKLQKWMNDSLEQCFIKEYNNEKK